MFDIEKCFSHRVSGHKRAKEPLVYCMCFYYSKYIFYVISAYLFLQGERKIHVLTEAFHKNHQ